MGLSLVRSRALLGLDARPVQVEVHLANGLPSFTLVGLADTEVKEARERVRSAIANAGLEFPSNIVQDGQPGPGRPAQGFRAASICRSRWASSQPAGRSARRAWSTGNLQASSPWVGSCDRCAARWP